jgi:hypothetical protein
MSWTQVIYICNPGYFGGWDQEDWSSMPARANWETPIFKNNQSKMNWSGGSSDRAPAL